MIASAVTYLQRYTLKPRLASLSRMWMTMVERAAAASKAVSEDQIGQLLRNDGQRRR